MTVIAGSLSTLSGEGEIMTVITGSLSTVSGEGKNMTFRSRELLLEVLVL